MITNNGQMINDSIINSRAVCSGVSQGPCWVWSSLMPLMIWKREWIEFIDDTQFSTEFMALNRMLSWHGVDGIQSGIEKDGLQSLVLHPWILAPYIRINIFHLIHFASLGFLWNIFFFDFFYCTFYWKTCETALLCPISQLLLLSQGPNLCSGLICI